jgi:hypothetical protein
VKKTLKIYKKFKPLHVEIFVLQASEFQPFWCPSSFEQKRFPSSLPQTLVNFPTHPHPPKHYTAKLAKIFQILAKSANLHYKRQLPNYFVKKKGKKSIACDFFRILCCVTNYENQRTIFLKFPISNISNKDFLPFRGGRNKFVAWEELASTQAISLPLLCLNLSIATHFIFDQ